MNDQRVHIPILLDAALLAGADDRCAFLPLHRDVGPGHLAAQVGCATLLQLQAVESLHKGDWSGCREEMQTLLHVWNPALP